MEYNLFRILKIGIISLLILVSLYYILTEIFLINNFNDQSDPMLFRYEYFDDPLLDPFQETTRSAILIGQHAPFQRDYLIRRNGFNPFVILAKAFHIEKRYYLCFEGIATPLPLKEEPSFDWFTDFGYSYGYGIGDYTEEQLEFIKRFPLNLDVNNRASVIKIKLTTSKNCEDYNNLDYLHEYSAKIYASRG